MGSPLKIGQLAKLTGESNATVRFWTKEGLLFHSSSPVASPKFSRYFAYFVVKNHSFHSRDSRLPSFAPES